MTTPDLDQALAPFAAEALFFGALALFAAVFYWLWRSRLRRYARGELRRLQRDYARDGNVTMLVSGITVLVRRVVTHRYGSLRTAGLAGDDWLAFLDAAGGTDGFCRGPGRILIAGPVKAGQAPQVQALLALIEVWIDRVA